MEVNIKWYNGEDNFYMGEMNNFCGLRGHKNCKVYTDSEELAEDIEDLIDNNYYPLKIEKVDGGKK